MVKKELENLLDKTYELEGLLQLALSRDDNHAALQRLIAGKSALVAAMAQRMAAASADDEAASLREKQYEVEAEAEAVPDTAPEPEAEAAVETTPVESAPEEMPRVEEAPVEVEEAPLAEVETVAEVSAPAPARSAAAKPSGKLVFSINDRYRYRRELFGGDDRKFAEALSKVASMDSYDEAEEYFLEDCQWEAERPEVVDFMNALQSYFEK